MKKYRFIIGFLLLFMFSYMINVCDNLMIVGYSNPVLMNYITEASNSNLVVDDIDSKKVITRVFSYLSNFNLSEPISIIDNTYKSLVDMPNAQVLAEPIIREPLVYIYNTHDYERYQSNNEVHNIVPNVVTASYLLKDNLLKYGIEAVVEDTSVNEMVILNGLSYNDSYKISRTLLETVRRDYPSIKYFIDVHRDSVNKNYTKMTYNEKTYARFLFVVGLENTNYHTNKEFMSLLNKRLNEKIPNISRGLYEKQGSGVNGVYNQDFNSNVILLEVGGVDNNLDEVYNSTEVFAEVFYNVIGDSDEKVQY